MEIQGLTGPEARDARERFGSNALTEQVTETFWGKFRRNFSDPIIRILCVALLIDVLFVLLGQTEWYEAVGIALAVLLATFVSTYSEYRNETAFRKLQEEASLIRCKVYRNGKLLEIPIDDIVVGDSVLVQTGDKIPADGVLVEGTLRVDQSVLNGEAQEAEKVPAASDAAVVDATLPAALHAGMGAQKQADAAGTGTEAARTASHDFLDPHQLFRGAVVCDGNGVMVVQIVGDRTVYGGIAGELQAGESRATPLQVKLGRLAGDISRFGYVGGVAIALAFMFDRIVLQHGFDGAAIAAYCTDWAALGGTLVDAVILAVVIIVMAVPEGLPLMIALVSAQNMGKMLRDNVLVRKVAGIETAGSLNILFSDKTGTITKGQLEAVAFVDGTGQQYGGFAELPAGLARWTDLVVRYNTSAVVTDGVAVGGNMTERALLAYVQGTQAAQRAQVVRSLPFNSRNKYSLAEISGPYAGTLVKGAPEKILRRCTTYRDTEGRRQPLTDAAAVEARLDALAGRAIRVLALATFDGPLPEAGLPSGLTFVGAVGIRDDVRPESIAAIREVQAAGVQVVMITGDRLDTATAIAREAGLLQAETDLVMTSAELAALSDAAVRAQLPRLRVVARALPADKSRLVRIAQSLNLVVGMTGDGVNDSPALKQADVGFAMGGGTEVAKEASEIVILDDNFHSIERAILYGRTIFHSIRKFLIFQLTVNVGAVLVAFVMPLLGQETPLTITQILWVNLIMDTLAALAFGGEPALARFMQERPKRRDEHIISRYMASSIGVGALWAFGLSLFFLLSPVVAGVFRADSAGRYLLTGYFAFFIFYAICNAFNARTEALNLLDSIGQNKGFLRVMGGIALVQVAMVYFGGAVLRCYGLTLTEWACVLLLALTIIPVDIARKALLRQKNEHSRLHWAAGNAILF